MTDDEFDAALIGGAFAVAARAGWPVVSVAAAAREAALPLERARVRCADRYALLQRFSRHADVLALTDALESGTARERLFDVLMRRFDALQGNRAGVLALLRGLPADPAAALLLTVATTRSMGWMLEAAGLDTRGLAGAAATQTLVAVWLSALRAWARDESADLSGTMAALDRGLTRAERLAAWLRPGAGPSSSEGPKPFPDPEAEIEAEQALDMSGEGEAGMPPAEMPLPD